MLARDEDGPSAVLENLGLDALSLGHDVMRETMDDTLYVFAGIHGGLANDLPCFCIRFSTCTLPLLAFMHPRVYPRLVPSKEFYVAASCQP